MLCKVVMGLFIVYMDANFEFEGFRGFRCVDELVKTMLNPFQPPLPTPHPPPFTLIPPPPPLSSPHPLYSHPHPIHPHSHFASGLATSPLPPSVPTRPYASSHSQLEILTQASLIFRVTFLYRTRFLVFFQS